MTKVIDGRIVAQAFQMNPNGKYVTLVKTDERGRAIYGFRVKPKLTEEQKNREKKWILAETDRRAGVDKSGNKLERGEVGSCKRPEGYSFERTQNDYNGGYVE